MAAKSNDPLDISFKEEMTIYHAIKMYDELKESFGKNLDLNIDLSKVKKIDSSGFQLLLLAIKEAQEKKMKIKFIKPSKEVVRIFSLYGEEKSL